MRRSRFWAGAAVALATFLPFTRGALSGRAFYFRDLSRQFFPLRAFAVEGLLRGEVRYWNPFLHEGEPLSLPSLSYPFDLLQLVFHGESGFSLLLALHVPLGALAFMALALALDLSLPAAAGGALVYGLGGFYLSMLNFYVYLQAAAWAPLVILGLVRAAEGGRPRLAAAALFVALALSTTGAEIVAQAVLFGLWLGLAFHSPRRLSRSALALALGSGLAAPTLAALGGQLPGSTRGSGFPTEVVLAHSVHPLTLVQVVLGNFLGDLSDLPNRWWGGNFFPLGFPYVLSLYLGAAALCVAAVGAVHGRALRWHILLLGGLGLVVALGRWAGLALVVDAAPFLRTFRYPSKAFFTVHLAVALLVALGLDRLAAGGRAWRTLAASALAASGTLLIAPTLPALLPSATRFFLAGFLPPGYTWPQRTEVARQILSDAALGGSAVAVVAVLALVTLAGRLAPATAIGLLVAVVAADLLRTGAGLNPMATPDFYRLSPEMDGVARKLRAAGGRAFTCDPESGSAYFLARRLRPEHDAWTFAVFMETLTPAFNMMRQVPTAYSRDLTMLVPEERVLAPEEVGASAFPRVVDRLRAAGVAKVLSIDPLDSPALRLEGSFSPARIAPLAIHVYSLIDPLPLRSVATGRVLSSDERPDRLSLVVESDQSGVLIVRDAWAPGWSATVDGVTTPVSRAEGRYRGVPVPAGPSRVVLEYAPPGVRAGLALSGLSALLLFARFPLARN